MEARQERILLDRARRGDRRAFEELAGEHRDRLVALVHTRMAPHLRAVYEVGDVMQETLLRALRSIGRFQWQGDGSFMRWLGGIAEHVILKLAARYERDQKLALSPQRARSSVSPSRGLRREERFERLRSAVSTLSEDHRQVILLARIERLPITDIAARMDRTPAATRQLLHRALRALKAAFGDTESLGLPPRVLERDIDGINGQDLSGL